MNRIVFLATLLLGALSMHATSGQWRIHNTWDYFTKDIVDTPERTFIRAGGFFTYGGTSFQDEVGSLFVLDKETDEMMPYNHANYLHGRSITNMAYNGRGHYLFLAYDGGFIELLSDDDTLTPITGLASANINTAKKISNVTFLPARHEAYVAADFGFFIIDDAKGVITRSFILDKEVTGATRVGDYYFITTSEGLFKAPASERHIAWNTFQKVADAPAGCKYILPLDGDAFVLNAADIYTGKLEEDGSVSLNKVRASDYKTYSENRDGYILRSGWGNALVSREGKFTLIDVPVEYRNACNGSWDGATTFFDRARLGMASMKYEASEWKPVKEYPNTNTNVAKAFNIEYSPTLGMVQSIQSYNRFLTPEWVACWANVSAYKDGTWLNRSAKLPSNVTEGSQITNAYGCTPDPLNPDIVWFGTQLKGLVSLDMKNNNFEFYTYQGGIGAGKPYSHAVFPPVNISGNRVHMGVPRFDANGTLWVAQNIKGTTANNLNPIWYWSAADRQAGSLAGIQSLPVKGFEPFGATHMVEPLRHTSNKGTLLLYSPTRWAGGFYVINYGSNPADPSDDKVVRVADFYDENGNKLQNIFTQHMYEDPQTGTVWVATSTGLFTFRPSDMLAGNTRVHRIIVARNDGTGQGDYLLAGQDIMHINSDGAGRKWFATIGNGVVVTSPSGDEILEHFTEENSMLPSNDVYVITPNPENNEIWIGNRFCTATYYSDVTPGSQDFSEVVSYPNPVRPDYYGQVTIQGLMDQSLVKIIDQGGNLVKELGISQGGTITWDLTRADGSRASTGVYFIAASTDSRSSANVGKILVVR